MNNSPKTSDMPEKSENPGMLSIAAFLKSRKHFHFIGAGGSGMYPLIQIIHKLCSGSCITGSDNNETETVAAVRKLGITVYGGQAAENIGDADCVIYSAAIARDNPELVRAREVCGEVFIDNNLGVSSPDAVATAIEAAVATAAASANSPLAGSVLLERSVLLGLITALHPVSACVCGTHGKTTTTSMLPHIVLAAGIDASALIGGKIKVSGATGTDGTTVTTAGLYGDGGVMVTEACEFADTFLKLRNDITVVLNIDNDHMDYFKTIDNLVNSFICFIGRNSDFLIVNGDDFYTEKAVKLSNNSQIPAKTDRFYMKKPPNLPEAARTCNAAWYPDNVTKLTKTESEFDIMRVPGGTGVAGVAALYARVRIRVPGEHNIGNAVAAAAAASHISGVTPAAGAQGLMNFGGVSRRFEFCGRLELGGRLTADIADDYAHHPAEVAALLKTAQGMGYNRVIAVHQPFTYSRTFNLLHEFAEALTLADVVILTDIMGGREVNTCGVRTEDLAALLPPDKVRHCPTFDDAAAAVRSVASAGDLVLTFGCGDVYKVARMLCG